MRILSYTALCCALAFTVTPARDAQAADIDLYQFMKCYNLIVLGDYNAKTDVEGRTFVGGNMDVASANLYILPEDAAADCDYPELLVAGDVTGSAMNVDNGGSLAIGGSLANTVNMNGGGAAAVVGEVTGAVNNTEVQTTSVFLEGSAPSVTAEGTTTVSGEGTQTATSERNCNRCVRAADRVRLDVSTKETTESESGSGSVSSGGAGIVEQVRELTTGLSASLSSKSANNEMIIKTENNTGQLIVTGDEDIAVFEVTLAELEGLERIEISGGSAEAIVVNVTGASGNITMDFVPFSGEGGEAGGDVKSEYADKLVWNFPEATELNFNKAFFGSVIAPNAHGSNDSNINGTVVFDSFTQGDEIHVPSYAGPELE